MAIYGAIEKKFRNVVIINSSKNTFYTTIPESLQKMWKFRSSDVFKTIFFHICLSDDFLFNPGFVDNEWMILIQRKLKLFTLKQTSHFWNNPQFSVYRLLKSCRIFGIVWHMEKWNDIIWLRFFVLLGSTDATF